MSEPSSRTVVSCRPFFFFGFHQPCFFFDLVFSSIIVYFLLLLNFIYFIFCIFFGSNGFHVRFHFFDKARMRKRDSYNEEIVFLQRNIWSIVTICIEFYNFYVFFQIFREFFYGNFLQNFFTQLFYGTLQTPTCIREVELYHVLITWVGYYYTLYNSETELYNFQI